MQVSEVLAPQLRRLGRAVVDGVLPPRCRAWGMIVDEPDALYSPAGRHDVLCTALARHLRVCLALNADCTPT